MSAPALDADEVDHSPKPLRLVLLIVGAILALGLTWATRTANFTNIFIPGKDGKVGVFFVDPDCYSRMTRVLYVMSKPGTILKQHGFENAPFGTHPHTTVLMDYLIAIPGWMLGAERAGAYIGPVLGLLGALFLVLWAWRTGQEPGGAFWLLAAYALSPMLAQANLLGRPDHQALLVLLLLVALAAELALLGKPGSRGWAVVAGLAWGFGLWTSLYEPAVFLGASTALVLGLGWKGIDWKARAWEGLALVGVVVIGLIIERGVNLNVPGGGADTAFFKNWSGSIAEMKPLGGGVLAQMPGWVGWAVFAAPVLVGVTWWKTRDARALYIIGFLFLTVILAAWQYRWAPYFCLAYVLSMPWQFRWLEGNDRWWLHGALAILIVFPLASIWDKTIFPEGAALAKVQEDKADAVLARQVAQSFAGQTGGTFLAPWWLSPSLAYWSGVPGVAGSSHQSLPGTVESAKFYAETDWESAARILKARQVRWVVAYDPQRVLAVSQVILGEQFKPAAPGREALARTLFDKPQQGPNYLRLMGRNQYFVLYEVKMAVVDRWLEETAPPATP
jgi:hypothetical protein